MKTLFFLRVIHMEWMFMIWVAGSRGRGGTGGSDGGDADADGEGKDIGGAAEEDAGRQCGCGHGPGQETEGPRLAHWRRRWQTQKGTACQEESR